MKIKNIKLFKEKCYIDGNWIDSNDKKTIDVNNPSSLEIIGNVPKCGTDETKLAIEAANKALSDWKSKTAKERSTLLRYWFELIMLNQEDLAKIMTIEQGKPINESRGEIVYGASFIELYAEEAKRVYGETIPDPLPDRRIVVIKQPIGVVAAITPWNFPSSMIARKAGPALAVGCTIVIKPASQTPYSALALGVLAEEAGIPKGVINIVTGSAKEIGLELSTNPIVKKLSFTGSTEIGKILLAQSASTVKKVSMELGGHAPFIIFEDANIDNAINGILLSIFSASGQSCVAGSRLLIQDSIYDEVLQRVTKRVAEIRIGDPFDDDSQMGPLATRAQVENIESSVAKSIEMGGRLVCGGRRPPQFDNESLYYEPTIIECPDMSIEVAHKEMFGPVVSVLKFRDEQEAIEIANDTVYGLASGVFTTDIGRGIRMSQAIRAGIVWINTYRAVSPMAPFGGFKDSGHGRESGLEAVNDYTREKTVWINTSVEPIDDPFRMQ